MSLISKHLMPAACLLPQCIHLGPELWGCLKLLPFRERAELYSKFRVRASTCMKHDRTRDFIEGEGSALLPGACQRGVSAKSVGRHR